MANRWSKRREVGEGVEDTIEVYVSKWQKHTERPRYRTTYPQTSGPTAHRPTDPQTEREIHRQTERPTGPQIYTDRDRDGKQRQVDTNA